MLSAALAHSVAEAADQPESAMASIRGLIGNADCNDDSQCRTMAIGTKPCGGPEAYLAWSTTNTDANALELAVTNYNLERQKEIRRFGLLSNCAMVDDPGAVCAPTATPDLKSGGPRACRLRSARQGAANSIR